MAAEAGEKGGKRGQRFGRYEVIAHIASGGMGAVYKALDPDENKVVALKVMSPELAAKPNMIARFKREAMSAARLQHENIVQVYEFGEARAQETWFLALEFVEGKDLHDYINRAPGGRLNVEEARQITLQAARALEHAHQNQVVHRDVKPSNFLIVKREGKPVVKLTDFGLATLHDDDEHRVTKAGTTLGTVDYIAPEQARDAGKADIRSDMYSLGCTLFHMLTGRAPFNKGSLAERILQHIQNEPPDVCKLNEAVSPNLGLVVKRMLAKKPKDRYQTPRELIAHLENPDRVLQVREAEKKPRRAAEERPRASSGEITRKKRKPQSEMSWVPFAIGGSFVLLIAIVTMVALNWRRDGEGDKKTVEKKVEKPLVPVVETKTEVERMGPPLPELRPLYKPVLPLDAAALAAEYAGPFKSLPEPPPGTPVVVVSRAPVEGQETSATLQEACGKLPGQGACIIEFRDQGPHFVGAAPPLADRDVWLRAAPGYRPLLAWDVGEQGTLISLLKGSLTVENLDVVVRGAGTTAPVTLFHVRGGGFQAQGCNFLVTGAFPAGLVLARLEGSGAATAGKGGASVAAQDAPETRFRFSRSSLRGRDAVLLSTHGIPLEALCDGSLVAAASQPLIQLAGNENDPSTLRLLRSTLVAGPALARWQLVGGKGGSPRLRGFVLDALLAAGDAGGDLLHLAEGASPQLAAWKVVNSVYTGWRRLLVAGDQTIVTLDAWRSQWGHREGDQVLAESWPGGAADPADLPAAAFYPHDTAAGFLAMSGPGALGCDIGRLPPDPPQWRQRAFEPYATPPFELSGDEVPEIPTSPEGYYHGERIELAKVDLGLHLQARLQTMTPGPRVVLHLSGRGVQLTSPIRFRGVENVVIYFEPFVPGPKEKADPLTLDLKPGGERSALIEVQGGGLEIIQGRFRFENSRIALSPPHVIKVQGGDLRLTRCSLTGPLSKSPDSFRSVISFEGAGVGALQPATASLRDCVFQSGKSILELRGTGYRLRSRGCLYYALGDAVALDLGAMETSRPDVLAIFEHNTIAARQAFAALRVHDGPQICLPVVVQAHNNYFLDPFVEESRQSSLLRLGSDILGRGLVTWQGKGNIFSDRWHSYAALGPSPPRTSLAAWQRLGGRAGEASPQVIEPLTAKGFAVDQPAFDRLALPASIRIEPAPGADLARLGLVKKK